MIINPITKAYYFTAADVAKSEQLLENARKQRKEVEELIKAIEPQIAKENRLLQELERVNERGRVIKIDFTRPRHK